jgi:hypothetical protein
MSWFASWFKHPLSIEESMSHVLSWRLGGGQTCFLGDADVMVLRPEFLHGAMAAIKARFPLLCRFTAYGKTRMAARNRSLQDLRGYREAGLHRVHFGLESGLDTVLSFVKKGSNKTDHVEVEACNKTIRAGLSCSVYVIPGLGGVEWSDEHADETAEVLSQITADFIRLRSLQVFPGTPLAEAIERGEFREPSEEQVVREICSLIENIDAETEVLNDSATNLLAVGGRLPDQKQAMLGEIDQYLALSEKEKLVFNFHAWLSSFLGQYGGLSKDIQEALAGFVGGKRLEPLEMPDDELQHITRLVRSKLMP